MSSGAVTRVSRRCQPSPPGEGQTWNFDVLFTPAWDSASALGAHNGAVFMTAVAASSCRCLLGDDRIRDRARSGTVGPGARRMVVRSQCRFVAASPWVQD